MSRHKRGQTLPMWLSASLLTVSFAFFLGDYGNTISYQFRAQSAADSAAAAVVSIQSQQFNQMLETLYATDIEEYRIRHILEGLRIVVNSSGGCNTDGSCAATYATLVSAYQRSLYRYNQDAQVLSEITTTMNFSNLNQDAHTFIDDLNASCASNTPTVLSSNIDCGSRNALFSYNLVQFTSRTNNLKAVAADAMNNLLPSYSNTGPSQANMNMFAPAAAEVSVCAVVPPYFATVWPVNVKPVHIVARAAATDVMVEQDWIQPGNSINPLTGDFFQPYEEYSTDLDTAYNGSDPNGNPGHGWYNVDYAGNASRTMYSPGNVSATHIIAQIFSEEFSARTGWWGPIPIFPFTPLPDPSEVKSVLGEQCG